MSSQKEQSGDNQSQKTYSSGQKLSSQDSYEMGMQRESWCAVESKKEQDWCRATRKHFNQQFKSSVFATRSPGDSDPRCTWSPNKASHRERRHFATHYDNQLKL